jgi:AcrR family transcriptional regulator
VTDTKKRRATKRPVRAAVDGAGASNEQATRRAVIDAAVACILERGFYRASSNEIARRAGVTWGVIQHHFGTREALMLAVLEDGARRFSEDFAGAAIDGATVAERLDQLLDLFARHYGEPSYLAYMQVALNMDHDPATSREVRATMQAVAERSTEQVRALIRSALGPATSVPDLATTLFLVVRGFLVSQQLLETIAHDATVPEADRVARQRRLLSRMLAPYVEGVLDQQPKRRS